MTLDPRMHNLEPITPTPPLPYVSRRALARVKHPLPRPLLCDYCSGPVRLISNSEIYGTEYGDWPYAYACSSCDAYVGLHNDTDLPLGTMADKETRDARKLAKEPFQKLWMIGNRDGRYARRTKAYAWLASAIQIPAEECHFSMFDQERAEQAHRLCQNLLNGSANKPPFNDE